MKTDGTPSSVTPVLLVSTALLSTAIYSFNDEYKMPIPSYNHEIVQEYNDLSYSSIDNYISILSNIIDNEPIIELKTTRKLKIKINKANPLKIVNIQNSEGFI